MITQEELLYLQQVIATKAQAGLIHDHYAQYLANKYQLKPGESIKPDGTLVRLDSSSQSKLQVVGSE